MGCRATRSACRPEVGRPAFASPGRWFRGTLHAHSDRSDGVAPPEQVIAAYRAAGYDFLVLTDHFEARWGWSVTDTSAARDGAFTTLLGAELSSADREDEDVFSENAIGLPADFAAPAAGEPHAAAIRRAAEAGAGKLRSPQWRVTVTAEDGARTWTNPVWV